MILVVHPGSRIRMPTFYPSRIPDPGVKKAPDPGSGSATLVFLYNLKRRLILFFTTLTGISLFKYGYKTVLRIRDVLVWYISDPVFSPSQIQSPGSRIQQTKSIFF
jgi:hypothetical protein